MKGEALCKGPPNSARRREQTNLIRRILGSGKLNVPLEHIGIDREDDDTF
jgi:hypothetical protein